MKPIFYSFFLFSFLLSGHSLPAKHALWVWDMADDVVLSEKDRMDFWSFIEAPHAKPELKITTIYLSIGKNLLNNYPKKVSEFITDAHSRGLKVEYLTGDPLWALSEIDLCSYEGDGDRSNGCILEDEDTPFNLPSFLELADLLAYNAAVQENERFDGYHQDTEPYTLSEDKNSPLTWGVNTEEIWSQFMVTMSTWRSMIDQHNNYTGDDLIMGSAIPFWWDPQSGTAVNYETIFEKVDYVSIMNYNTRINNELISVGESVLREFGAAFSEGDFGDFEGLVLDLIDTENAVSQFLYSELEKFIDAFQTAYGGDSNDSDYEKDVRDALAKVFTELNRRLWGSSLYDEVRFEGIDLSDKTSDLLATDPQGLDLIRLNRLLLEDAYPQIVKIQEYENKIYVGMETLELNYKETVDGFFQQLYTPSASYFYGDNERILGIEGFKDDSVSLVNFFSASSNYGGNAFHFYEDIDNGDNALRALGYEPYEHAPAVWIISPSHTQTLSGTETIEYVVYDPDGDTLNVKVEYSSNSGANWSLLSTFAVSDQTNEIIYRTLPWDVSALSPGTDYLIRITATEDTTAPLSNYDQSDYLFSVAGSKSDTANPNPVEESSIEFSYSQSREIELWWDESTDNNGIEAVAGYYVSYTANNPRAGVFSRGNRVRLSAPLVDSVLYIWAVDNSGSLSAQTSFEILAIEDIDQDGIQDADDTLDRDGDGVSDSDEVIDGTDPNDPLDFADSRVIGHWQFEGDLSNSIDAGPVLYEETAASGAISYENGIPSNGQALEISGTSPVWLPSTTNSNLSSFDLSTPSLTIEMWIKPDLDSEDDLSFIPLACFGDAYAGLTLLLKNNGDLLSARRYTGATSGNYTSVNAQNDSLFDGNWHHVACTYNGHDGALKLYVDGELVSQHLGTPSVLNSFIVSPISIHDFTRPPVPDPKPDGYIREPPYFVTKLKNSGDLVSQYLYNELEETTKDLLNAAPEQTEADEEIRLSVLESALAHKLNKVINDDEKDLYDEDRFAGIDLSLEAELLKSESLDDNGRAYLNRMLLEDAYSQEIIRRASRQNNTLRFFDGRSNYDNKNNFGVLVVNSGQFENSKYDFTDDENTITIEYPIRYLGLVDNIKVTKAAVPIERLGYYQDRSEDYNNWKSDAFGADASNTEISDPEVDYSKDGISNFLAYTSGLDPSVNNSTNFMNSPTLETKGGQQYLSLRYLESKTATSNFQVQTNTTLNPLNWSDQAEVVSYLDGESGNSWIKKVSVPFDGDSLFLRLWAED